MAEPHRRIAILLPVLTYGGAERVAINLARALRALGWEVVFIVMTGRGELFEQTSADFPVVDLDCDRTRKLPGKLARYLAEHPVDILLSNFWKLNLCACLAVLGRRPRPRLLLWEHSPPSLSRNSPSLLYAISASILYRAARAVVCVSTGVRDDVARLTVGLGSRLRMIYNPIPAPTTMPDRAPAQANLVAWVGRLEDPKNPGLLIEALPLLAAEVRILYIGDGSSRPALEQRAAALGVADRVTLAGFVADPAPLLATCSLIALTSDREGLPTVLIEALHLGLRAVATDCGRGVHEILEPDYGTIVAKNNPAALASAIMMELARIPDRELQKQGAARFAPAQIARQFLAAAGY